MNDFVKIRNHLGPKRVDKGKTVKVPGRDTAILLFTRTSNEEFRAKSFGLKFSRFHELYQTLINSTRQVIGSVDLPVFEIDSRLQQGNDFGSRLAHAIQQVATKGFSKVIVVGNDTPGLHAAHIHDAVQALSEGRNILGRDTHDGCYLIGLQTDQVDFEAFTQIQWQTNQVFDQLSDCLTNLVFLQSQLVDLNQKVDWLKLIPGSTLPIGLYWLFKRLLFGAITYFKDHTITRPATFQTAGQHRGPPSIAY